MLDQRLPAAIGAFHHHVAGVEPCAAVRRGADALLRQRPSLLPARRRDRSRSPISPASTSSIAAMAAASRRAVRGRLPGDGDGQQHGGGRDADSVGPLYRLSRRPIARRPGSSARLMRSLLPARLAYRSLFEMITRRGRRAHTRAGGLPGGPAGGARRRRGAPGKRRCAAKSDGRGRSQPRALSRASAAS